MTNDWVTLMEQKTGVDTPSYEQAQYRDVGPALRAAIMGVGFVAVILGGIFVKNVITERKNTSEEF